MTVEQQQVKGKPITEKALYKIFDECSDWHQYRGWQQKEIDTTKLVKRLLPMLNQPRAAVPDEQWRRRLQWVFDGLIKNFIHVPMTFEEYISGIDKDIAAALAQPGEEAK